MYKKTLFLFTSLFFSGWLFAQSNINNYQYFVVPMEYDFLNGEDQYRINTLTRYLFKQQGFETFFEIEDLPKALKNDRCKALYVEVQKAKGGFLATKLEIVLNDCFGKEVYKSESGMSREKDFKTAYSEALRNAFKSIEALDYNYVPLEQEEVKVKVNAEENTKVAVVDKVEDTNELTEEPKEVLNEAPNKNSTLYAQEKSYGYQVVDSEPKVVMQLLKTTAENIYMVKDKNAIVYKEDGFWYYSENNGELLNPKQLDIKF